MRTFGVEEEFLIVDRSTLELLPVGHAAVSSRTTAPSTGHNLAVELQQEQIEVICPPQRSFAGQLGAIREGRRLADEAVQAFGGGVAALATAPIPVTSHLDPVPRSGEIERAFRLLAREQLTCGLHTHVLINSRDEGVVALDRIRTWLPVFLALSSNSPFWAGQDTGISSFRRQVFGRWPNTGPTEVYSSAAGYDAHREALLRSGVPLDFGMLYFDARLSERHPTVEIRVADVCLEATHAAAIATLLRALVETVIRDHRSGVPLECISTALLQTWSWQAGRDGLTGNLIDPAVGAPKPAAEVVERLLDYLRPVLAETEDLVAVEAVVADILDWGTGAERQREAYVVRQNPKDVLSAALAATHSDRDAANPASVEVP